MNQPIHIALVGNPNSGKSSLFNALTGLNQKVGNFPGVTVDKKTGSSKISDSLKVKFIDLPGTYSLYPKRNDEWVTYKVLLDQDPNVKADIILVVADASNLKRNLLFCSQIIDLDKPVIIALTMLDVASKNNTKIDVAELQRELGVLIVPVNPRRNKGIVELKKAIEQTTRKHHKKSEKLFIEADPLAEPAVKEMQALMPGISNYRAVHYLINHENFSLDERLQSEIETIEERNNFNHTKIQ